MQVRLVESIDTFLELTAEHRAADPLRTNVIASVAQSVQSGRNRYDGCRWWVVVEGDVVVAMAMRTNPFAMVLAPMAREAAYLLGETCGHLDDELPGLSGSRDVVDQFLDGYRTSASPGSHRATRVSRHEHMYEVGALQMPSVDGQGRPARSSDVALLAGMFMAFVDEVDLDPISINDARESVGKSIDQGSLFCWEDGGGVVSFAGHAPLVRAGETLVARVGPVYTPPPSRGHGYASAVTAMVTRHLLDQGARVMLFTDAANPTSNAIYQALGYELLHDIVDVRFTD